MAAEEQPGARLPEDVAGEARRFFQFGIASRNEARPGESPRILSQLEGAMLIARSIGDPSLFAEATGDLVAA